MTLANAPDPLDRYTTAQGLFLSADAYLDAARKLQEPLSREGHATMPIRFLLYHAAELYLKAYLRLAGLSVSAVKALGHRYQRLMNECIKRGLPITVHDFGVLEHEETADQVSRSRYLKTGPQDQYGLVTLQAVVEGIRFDIRHHPLARASLVFRPWDIEQDTTLRDAMQKWERLPDASEG